MNATVLYRIDEAKHMRRFYRLDVQPDLFGYWRVVREWGRIGSSGRTVSAPFHSPEAAQAALSKYHRTKEDRGYVRAFVSP